ncbi:MAG: efflux RND transporter permease subunit [Armatimonadetes bacterium]|nr:efflux RND transporter permease subunit [Armatimonadota bacterium]NOG93271.1 efflux RND transporter permease subunit [Armatimonadota bacterium]
MIEGLIRFSIRQRAFVLIAALALVVYGVQSALRLPVDAVPDITNKQVQINAKIAALGPEEMERQVTFPIELAMASLPRLKETRSISQFGLSQITVVFEDDVDIYFARQLVNERLQEAKEDLPTEAEIEMAPVSTGLGEIYYVKIEGDERYSPMDLRTMLDWTVAPQLRKVQGLAEVNTWGGVAKQFHVLVDPEKLASHDFTVRDVLDAVAANNANAGGSYILRGAEQQIVRSIGLLQKPEEIGDIVIGAHDGVPIQVRDLAQVTEGGMVRSGAITENGKGEAVYAITMLLSGENGRIVVNRVKDRVTEIQKSLPEGTRLVGFLDRSNLIDRTLRTGATNLIEGGLLVIVLLFLFLLQFRAGLIVSSAIPLSMLIAIIGMNYFKVSANLMSLGAIDFGLIVDGAVIIVENIVRKLAALSVRLGRDIAEDERHHVVYEGTVEMLKPSLSGVIIIMAAYVPVLTLDSIEGKMFRPMGMTVLMALGGAVILSLTVVPALAAQFLRVQKEVQNVPLDMLSARYERDLQRAIRYPWVAAGAATAFVVVCGGLFARLGSEFIPELDEGAIAIYQGRLPSMSLEATIANASVIERKIIEGFPDEVARVVTRIGRPEIATDPMLPSQSDAIVELTDPSRWKRARTQKELAAKMAEELEHIPGVGMVFSQPVKLRMSELIEGVGIRADLAVKIYGDDEEKLARLGERVLRAIRGVKGAEEVTLEATEGLPQLQVGIRRDRIARYGINVRDINDVLEASLAGKVVTTLNDGTKRFDVAVKLPPQARDTPEKIARLMVPAPDGRRVPISELADIESVEGPVQVSRENGRRRVVVQSNVRGRDLGSFVEDAKRAVAAQVSLPPGYVLEWGGTYEQLQSGRARLALVVPLTFLAVFALLFFTLGSLKQALLVFTGIPFAVSGGVLALLARGMPFSMSAGIGFIALAGIAVLNGVVMITFMNQLRRDGAPLLEATVKGAVQRLRPVLMTASVAGFGFVPMALSHGAGAEVQRPLATVVIGGLITSTILTLIVLPTLYNLFERDSSRQAKT